MATKAKRHDRPVPPETVQHNGITLRLNSTVKMVGAEWDTYLEEDSTDPDCERIYERRRADGHIVRTV